MSQDISLRFPKCKKVIYILNKIKDALTKSGNMTRLASDESNDLLVKRIIHCNTDIKARLKDLKNLNMSNKTHPFKHIQAVEDICALLGETPEATAFDWAQELAFDNGDWDVVIHYLGMMISQLQEIAVEPLSQLCLLQMIDSVHKQPDINWDCIGNMDREVYITYRDSFLLFSDFDSYLLNNFEIL